MVIVWWQLLACLFTLNQTHLQGPSVTDSHCWASANMLKQKEVWKRAEKNMSES